MTCKSKIISQLIELGGWLHNRNFTPGYSGNISFRDKDKVIITTSGSANGFLSKSDFTTIDLDGNNLDISKKPSSEKMLHLAYYKTRTDINCVIHVHSTALSAFAAAGKDLMEPVMIENICYFGGIPLAEYAMPSSIELVEQTSRFFKEHSVVLMKNHGVIIGGSSIKDAYLKLEMAEEYAKTIIFANTLGGTQSLSQNEVNKLLELINS